MKKPKRIAVNEPSLPPLDFALKERKEEFAEGVRLTWAAEIGRLIVAFGAIESLTYTALKILPHDPVAPALKKLLLKDRIDVLLAILDAKDEAAYREFAKLLRAVQKLAAQRNLIAHNGLGIEIYVDANTGGVMALESIRSNKNEDANLDFKGLVAHREEAEQLEWELYGVWMFVSRVRELEGGG